MRVSTRLPGMRVRAESLMLDTCTITRDTVSTVLDEDTGAYPVVSVVMYDGKCRVRSGSSQGFEREAGDQFLVADRTKVAIPWDSLPPADVSPRRFVRGDVVTITAARSPHLQDSRFVVRTADDQSDPTALRLLCEEE